MNDANHTGTIVQAHADKFSNELVGIAVIADLLDDAETQRQLNGEFPKLVDAFRFGALLDAVQALADSAYSRLIFALGEEPE